MRKLGIDLLLCIYIYDNNNYFKYLKNPMVGLSHYHIYYISMKTYAFPVPLDPNSVSRHTRNVSLRVGVPSLTLLGKGNACNFRKVHRPRVLW